MLELIDLIPFGQKPKKSEYNKSSLTNSPIMKLQQIANKYGINMDDCLEKNDMIDKILKIHHKHQSHHLDNNYHYNNYNNNYHYNNHYNNHNNYHHIYLNKERILLISQGIHNKI